MRLQRYIVKVASIFLLLISTSAACTCPILETDLCDKCQCGINDATNKWTIRCNSRGLTQVPTFTSSPVQYEVLTLAGNQINTIPADKFKELSTLKELELTGNPIVSINSQAFSGLGNALEELHLEVDRITIFPKDALSVLVKLKTLVAKGFDLSSSSLPANALANLNQLSALHLQDNRLTSFSDNILTSQQSVLKELILDTNQLSSIPTAALSKLTALEYVSFVANTNLNSIPANAFQLSNIVHLDLSQNGLSSLDPNAFNGLSLQNLTMRSCQLTDAMLPAIQKVSSAQDLELSQNNLANIPNNFFNNFGDLKILNLHLCQIHTIRAETFSGLQNLEELELSSNGLTSVAPGTFTSTPKLASLNLRTNNGLATQLPTDIFQPLDSTLEVLDLQGTAFLDSHWPMLENLPNLRTLTLSKNQVQNLPDLVFENKKLLESVYLDENQLSEVKQEGLYGPNNKLGILNLNANSLTTVTECVFHEFTAFDFFQLNLNNNPLHCDCHLAWLLETLMEDPDFEFERYGLNWQCSSPPNLAGKKFAQDLVLGDLVCDPPVTAAPCLDLSPTPAPTAPPPSVSTENQNVFSVNFSQVTDVSVFLFWTVGNTEDLSGFRVEHWQIPDGEKDYAEYSASTRNATISELEAQSDYIICVMALGVSWPGSTVCESLQTMPPSGELKDPKNNTLTIALACSLGVLVIIVIIIVVVCVKRKQKENRKKPSENGYFHNSMGVRIGGESKRFSKPEQKIRDTAYFQNQNNVAFEHGLTKEEQNRILGLISQNGASTLSMLSTASSHRYVRDLPAPPTEGATGGGYLNAAMAKDDIDKHVYCEIPGEGNYQEIPDSFI